MNITVDSLDRNPMWSDSDDSNGTPIDEEDVEKCIRASEQPLVASSLNVDILSPLGERSAECIANSTALGRASSVAGSQTSPSIASFTPSPNVKQVSSSSSSSSWSSSPSPSSFARAPPNKGSLATSSSSGRVEQSIRQIQASASSPWEKWLVRKAREDYEKRKLQRTEKADRRRNEKERRALQAEKKQLALQQHAKWVRSKVEEERCSRRTETKERKEKRVQTVQKEEEIKARAEESFEHWKRQKEIERRKLNKQKQAEEELKEKAQLERKLRAFAVYGEWLERTERTYTPRGRGYRHSSPPSSSFVNRQPWIGPCDSGSDGTDGGGGGEDGKEDSRGRFGGSSHQSSSRGDLVCRISSPTKVISIRTKPKRRRR